MINQVSALAKNDPETCETTVPCETDTQATPGYLVRTLEAIREGATVAGMLRMGGAALMVFSLSLFLIQGVDAASDLQRYLLLLGQTLLLTTAGFAVGYLLKEPRGARVFFSLGLISIPANFAVLGAMIYSIAPMDTLLTDYPTYAKWASASLDELLMASAAALVVLVPMCVFCFAVMARQSKWWLSAGYLLSCTTLLIPVRETLSITIISSMCALAVVALLANRQMKTQRQSTGEERFAKALLFVPAVLLLARSATLYHVDFHFALAIVIAAYYLLRHSVARTTGKSMLSTAVQILTATGAFILAAMLTSLISSTFPVINAFALFACVLLALNIDLVRLMATPKMGGVVHGCWAVLCFSSIATDTLLFGGYAGFTVNMILAVLLTSASVMTGQKTGAILGMLSMVGVLVVNGSHLFSVVLDTGWVGMAAAGASTIVAGSLLERYWPLLKLTWQQRFSAQVERDNSMNTTSEPDSFIAHDTRPNITPEKTIDPIAA